MKLYRELNHYGSPLFHPGMKKRIYVAEDHFLIAEHKGLQELYGRIYFDQIRYVGFRKRHRNLREMIVTSAVMFVTALVCYLTEIDSSLALFLAITEATLLGLILLFFFIYFWLSGMLELECVIVTNAETVVFPIPNTRSSIPRFVADLRERIPKAASDSKSDE